MIQLKSGSQVRYVNKRFVYILNCCNFLKYDVLSEYQTSFWFAMLLNEYEIEFMFRKTQCLH